mmetsp:Transcript_48575/g.95852  ORF Transcript_48575/g.95852 Transcript_48575/m.95852 type:complete len:138 (-) Transcript_48575:1042-1455(-)
MVNSRKANGALQKYRRSAAEKEEKCVALTFSFLPLRQGGCLGETWGHSFHSFNSVLLLVELNGMTQCDVANTFSFVDFLFIRLLVVAFFYMCILFLQSCMPFGGFHSSMKRRQAWAEKRMKEGPAVEMKRSLLAALP